MFLIAWLCRRPFCWAASIDGGITWTALQADDPEYVVGAITEASDKFRRDAGEWKIEDDPISSLKR